MIRCIILERHIKLRDIRLGESRLKLGRGLRSQMRNDDGLKVDNESVGAKRREEKMQYLEDTVWSETCLFQI